MPSENPSNPPSLRRGDAGQECTSSPPPSQGTRPPHPNGDAAGGTATAECPWAHRPPPPSSSLAPTGPPRAKHYTLGRRPAATNDDDYDPQEDGGTTTTAAGGTQTLGGTTATLGTSTSKHRHVGGVTPLGLQAVVKAMEYVKPSLKVGYTRACAACPEAVLERECCPCYFLVVCHHNPWDAATKMCKYWNERINVFGEDRAFQALTLGSGDDDDAASPPTGLQEDDLPLFHTGLVQILPNDSKGRSVLCLVDGRLDYSIKENTEGWIRVLWYVLQAAYTGGQDSALCHRVVVLLARHDHWPAHRRGGDQALDRNPPSSRCNSPAVWRYAMSCQKVVGVLPVVVDSIRLLSLSSRTGTGSALRDMWNSTIALASGYFSKLFTMHHGTSSGGTLDPYQADAEAREDLMKQLKVLGFTRRGVPDWAGGMYSLEDFRAWTRQLRRRERRDLWTDDQRAQHKRNVNRAHSRKKRQRRLEEVQALEKNVLQLSAANDRARAVGNELEQLIVAATDLIQEASQVVGPTQAAENVCGPVLSEAQFPPDVLASLEPDPIAPHCLPKLAPFVTADADAIDDKLRKPSSFVGCTAHSALRGPSFSLLEIVPRVCCPGRIETASAPMDVLGGVGARFSSWRVSQPPPLHAAMAASAAAGPPPPPPPPQDAPCHHPADPPRPFHHCHQVRGQDVSSTHGAVMAPCLDRPTTTMGPDATVFGVPPPGPWPTNPPTLIHNEPLTAAIDDDDHDDDDDTAPIPISLFEWLSPAWFASSSPPAALATNDDFALDL